MSMLRWLVSPLAPLYGAVVKARNRAFDHHPERAARAEAPVVSIGNLSTGGTGKTPVALALAEALAGQGWPNAILSRGYRGKRDLDPMDVGPDSNPREAGDEPVLMARRLGPGRVIVGRKRHAAALRALSIAPKPRMLLLDGIRRWGNGRMLPLGDLREPMSSASRADALVVTRGSRADRAAILAWWECYGSGGPVFWVDFAIGALRRLDTGERLPLPANPGPLLAFCALGHPEAFYADLLVAGLSWVETRSFLDHHPVSPGELERLQNLAKGVGAEGLICTEKDAVKLGSAHLQRLSMPLWVAEQSVLGGEALTEFVRESLEKRFGSR